MEIEEAAKKLAGNWRKFDNFVWHRSGDLDDADNWMIFYKPGSDAGLLAESNDAEIAKVLAPFTEGDDPDVVAEHHSHWAVGDLGGLSIRVYRPDGSITQAFQELHQIKTALDDHPVLNPDDYAEREYEATLNHYELEMWQYKNDLPEGWGGQVHSWFSNHRKEQFVENRDDQGGWAPKDQIIEALQDLGLLPTAVVEQ